MLDQALKIYFVCTLLFALCLTANGQRQESFEGFMAGIRANTVQGEVVYQRADGVFPLEAGLKLEEGDFVRSRKDSYAELLLQPGNYVRIGGNTEFQIFSEPHDKMRLKLNDGTLVVEILSRETSNFWLYQMEESTELIRVITPDGVVFIDRPGIFRINTTPGGRTQVVVREGEAVFNGYRVKKKRRAITESGSVSIAEIDTKLEDNLDAWSR